MLRALLLALLPLLPLAAVAAEPAIVAEALASPAAGSGATGSSLAVGRDGTVWLTWLEATAGSTALKLATFDAARKAWSAPTRVAEGPDLFVNGADFPALTAGAAGRATVVWFVNNPPDPSGHAHGHHGSGYHALYRQTGDGGRTWSAPAPLTRESTTVEFVSLATLPDGRVLAAWLDGRGKASAPRTPEGRSTAAQQLYARVIGSSDPDTRVDASVCDCCQTSLRAFPDGSAVLAYRARRDGEIRDVHVARFDGQAWGAPAVLHQDGWKIAGCPVNGPQLAVDGSRVAAAWFTAANDDPRVIASVSSDAGGRFLSPLRLNEGKPAGRVSTVLLHDGALLVSFVDADGALWLRRVTPDFSPSPPVRLTRPEEGRIKGFPRLALLRDFRHGKEPALVLATFGRDAGPALQTLLITVPEAELLAAENSCGCGPSPDQLRGFPLRGTIVATDAARGVWTLQHEAVPGIFAAGTREFRVTPEVAGEGAAPGRPLFGRFDETSGGWELLEVRLMAPPRKR